MSGYPKWLYHASQAAQIVESAADHEALGPAWHEAPVAAREAGAEPGAETGAGAETPVAPRRRRAPRAIAP